jgi:hypothetical protein
MASIDMYHRLQDHRKMQLLPPLNNASRIASTFSLDYGGKELGVIMKGGDDRWDDGGKERLEFLKKVGKIMPIQQACVWKIDG